MLTPPVRKLRQTSSEVQRKATHQRHWPIFQEQDWRHPWCFLMRVDGFTWTTCTGLKPIWKLQILGLLQWLQYPFTTVFSPVLLVDYFLVVYACSGRFRRGAKQPVKEAQDWSAEFEGVKGLKEARNPSRRAGKKSKQSCPYVCLPNRSCSNLARSGDQFAEGHQCCQSGLRTKNVLNS